MKENTFVLSDDGTPDTVITCTCGRCGKSQDLRFNTDLDDQDRGLYAGLDDNEYRIESAMEMAKENFACGHCDFLDTPPNKEGRHPEFCHLVWVDVKEHSYGGITLTTVAFPGEEIFLQGEYEAPSEYDAEGFYITDEFWPYSD